MRKYGLDKVHDAIIVEEANGLLEVILVEEGEPDWSTSINAFMISEGLGSLDQEALTDDTTPEEVLEWQSYSDEAREKMLGLWKNEGNAAVSDDD